MVIYEYQFCNAPHECDTAETCNTPIREYNLPDHQRASWHDFFTWLIAQGVIENFRISENKK